MVADMCRQTGNRCRRGGGWVIGVDDLRTAQQVAAAASNAPRFRDRMEKAFGSYPISAGKSGSGEFEAIKQLPGMARAASFAPPRRRRLFNRTGWDCSLTCSSSTARPGPPPFSAMNSTPARPPCAPQALAKEPLNLLKRKTSLAMSGLVLLPRANRAALQIV